MMKWMVQTVRASRLKGCRLSPPHAEKATAPGPTCDQKRYISSRARASADIHSGGKFVLWWAKENVSEGGRMNESNHEDDGQVTHDGGTSGIAGYAKGG